MRCSGEILTLAGKDRLLQTVPWSEDLAGVSDLSCGEIQVPLMTVQKQPFHFGGLALGIFLGLFSH